MEKPIVLIVSCLKDRFNGRANASRKTWIATWGHLIPHQFVLGQGNCETFCDELVVPVNDSYFYHPFKQRAAYRWALDNGYDQVFLAYTDTYLDVGEFLKSAPDHYTGRRVDHGPTYASGGCGYSLSAHAMKTLLEFECHPGYGDEIDGAQLAAAGIHLTNNTKYGTVLSAHLGKATDQFDPVDMYRHHMETLDAKYEGRKRVPPAASDPLDIGPVQDTGC